MDADDFEQDDHIELKMLEKSIFSWMLKMSMLVKMFIFRKMTYSQIVQTSDDMYTSVR